MKYEFTGETKIGCGITLRRIRASIAFARVAKGEVGMRGKVSDVKGIEAGVQMEVIP